MNSGSPSPRPETARFLDESTGPLDPGRWVDIYGDFLYRMAMVRLRDGRAAEELTRKVLTDAIRARRFFQDPAMEKLWLSGIFKNHLHQHIAHAVETSVKVNLSFYEESLRTTFLNRPDGQFWSDPDGVWDLNFLDHLKSSKPGWSPCLTEALRKLEWPAFVVLTLRDVDGLSISDIGQILGLTDSDVLGSLYRARMAFRDLVQKEWQRIETVTPD